MNRKNGFLTFIFACIPGTGYMYYGLLKKGLDMLMILIIASILPDVLGIGILSPLIIVPLWFYCFFDTFNVARKYERGEILEDKSVFTEKTNIVSSDFLNNNKILKITGWVLIILGIFAIMNKVLEQFGYYDIVKAYLIPIIFIGIGVYILVKKK